MTSPPLKLTYFDMDGRAAVIRKTLQLGGVSFVDERLSKDQFMQHKASFPYGKVPVLTVDGDEMVAETQAILRYAGRLTMLYPPAWEPVAAAMTDEMIDSFDDIFERLMAPSFHEKNADTKKQMVDELLKGPLPHAFDLLEKRLQQIAAYPYFARNASTLHLYEVLVWDYVEYLRSGDIEHVPTTFIDTYQLLMSIHAKVASYSCGNQSISPSDIVASVPTQLHLSYFDLPFRAEHIRLALHLGGLSFQDERLSWDEVTKRKHEFPNEQVPVLVVNGTVTLAQSNAILRYVGTITGLYPVEHPGRACKVDEVLSHIGELYFACLPSLAERDPTTRQQLRAELATSTIPLALASLESRLSQWKLYDKKSPWALGGESLTIADLAIYNLLLFFQTEFLRGVPTTIADGYRRVIEISDAVQQHPRVTDWYAQHPQFSKVQ